MTNDWEEMEYRSNKLVKIIWYTWQKLSVNVWHFNSAKSLRFCRHIGATGQKRRKAIHVRYFFANKLQYTYSVIAQSSTKTTIHEEVLYISILFSVHSIEIVWFLPSNLEVLMYAIRKQTPFICSSNYLWYQLINPFLKIYLL